MKALRCVRIVYRVMMLNYIFNTWNFVFKLDQQRLLVLVLHVSSEAVEMKTKSLGIEFTYATLEIFCKILDISCLLYFFGRRT